MEEQITIKQAAKLCSVALSTIHKMIRTGKMPQTTKGFIPKSAVLGYKARRETNLRLLAEQRGGDDGGWERKFDGK